jgi:hypothetical protein
MKLPIQAQPVMRGVSSSKLAGKTINPSECSWLRCGAKVLECASACYEGGVGACLACLGTSYAVCKDCFSDIF